jgi:hypothetical protein
MIRLTSRVVQPPASGVPATNKRSFQEVRYETMLLCSLAGAKPGSTITNERISRMLVTRLVVVRTNNINVEAGNAKQW